jgi:iron complex transport system substrate-binding protein
MKKSTILLLILFAALSGCRRSHSNGTALQPGQRALTDMAGRTVIVPTKITRVYGMSPVGTILVYTLSPETLVGWNYRPDPGEFAFYKEPYNHLPVLGGWYGKNNTGNIEAILQAHPDVLITMGDPMGAAVADRVQQQTHIPVYFLDGDLQKIPETYLKAGELLGNPTRAAELATQSRATLDEIRQKVAAIPPSKRKRVYYAEGSSGLETEPGGSTHSESLIYAGAVNVADVPNQQGYGHTPVSMEQILSWNPDIVISGYDHSGAPGKPGDFYSSVWSNPGWKHVRAVKDREVYEVPQYPFCWIDRPPSVNRILGIRWIANLLYPDIFHDDMRAVTRQFYSEFYHWQLSDSELDRILATATRKTK